MDISKVYKLGFGTSQIGGPSLINGQITGARPIPKSKAINILKYAFDHGINFYDTSDKYGNAEDLLGDVFFKIRDKVIIATKCGLTDTNKRNFSISYINTCIENSLQRLRTDYIDIFQLTKPGINDVTDELLYFFEKKIREGKIRYFGISVTGNEDGRAYLSKKTIKSFQIFYNLLFVQNHELVNRCAQNEKFVIVRSPLNSGILSGQYTLETKFDRVDSRSRIFHGVLLKKRLEYIEKLKFHFNLSAEEVLPFSLNFIFSNKNINVVIPAASQLSQLQNYAKIFSDRRYFNETEINKIVSFISNNLQHNDSGQFK